MKNKIKYFILFPLMLLIVILTLTYDVKELIGLGQRIPFGSSYWKDSLVDAISTNKSIKLGTGDSIYYNGVVVTSGTGGGGIAASDNTTFSGYNTFSNGVTFSDSIRANGYSLIDDANILTSLRVNGDVLTNLEFNKGSSTSIGTIGTDSLAFITANTKRIVIDKNGYTVFTDTVQMLDRVYISGNLNVASNLYTIGNVTADSIAGIGRFITEVDAITLKGHDTTHFAHTDTLTTERVKSKTEFSDIVTFFLSPVFSALVTFANGITVTTITASSTATFNGDQINTGWKKIGSSKTQYQYTRDTVIWAVCTTGPTTITTTHGLGNIGRLISYTCVIKDDSSGLLVSPGVSTGLVAVGLTPQAPTFDATNIYFRITGPMVNLDDNTDTIKYFIKYSDFQR